MKRFVYQTCQINQFWQKNSSFLIQKTPLLFPRKTKVWNFWEILSKNTIWDAFYRNIAKISHFQKVWVFFANFFLLSRNSQADECFKFCWAFILFKRNLEENATFTAFGKKKGSSQKQHLFLQKTQKFDCFENSEAIWKSDTHSW